MLKSKNSEHDEALEIAQRCYRFSTEWYGLEHPQTLYQRGVLKRIEYHNGYKSKEVVVGIEEIVAQEIEILGKEHPQTLDSMSLLANIYSDLGMIEAETVFRDILDTKLEYLGDNNPNTLKSYLELANYLWRTRQFDEAEKRLQDFSHLANDLIDMDHPMLLEGKQKLSHIFFDLGMFDKSKSIYEGILSYRRDKLGNHHKLTIDAIVFLGQTYGELGDYKRAEALFKEALDLRLTQLPHDYFLIAACYNNLGLLYRNNNSLKAALVYLQKAYDYLLKCNGNDDEVALITRRSKALVLLDMDMYEEGASILMEILKIRLENTSLQSREISICFGDLVGVYTELAILKEANDLLELIQKHLPSDNLEELASIESSFPVNLARLYYLTTKPQSAINLLEHFIKKTKQKRNLDSDLTRIAIKRLVGIYLDTNQFQRIPELCRDWLAIVKNIYGLYDERAEEPLENHITALIQMGSIREAHFVLALLLKVRKKINQPLKILETLFHLVGSSCGLKRIDDARQYLQEIEQITEIHQVPTPAMINYYFSKAVIEESDGDIEKADHIFLEIYRIISDRAFEDKNLKIHVLLQLYHFYKRRETPEISNKYYFEALEEAKTVSTEALNHVKNSK